MAKKKKGPFEISGTIDGLTHYSYMGIPCVRKKSNLDKARVLSDPAFEDSLKSASRLSKASRAARIFRHALAPFDGAFADGQLHNRLISKFTKLQKTKPEIFQDPQVDYKAMETILKRIEFRQSDPFDNTVAIELEYYLNTDRTGLQFEANMSKGGLFRNAPCSTYFKIMLILAPLVEVKTPRIYDPEKDIAPEATWVSEWIDANTPSCHCEYLQIPEFMRQYPQIAICVAIQPGIGTAPQIDTAKTGRAMKLLGII
jgi:hypothetical protein